VGQKKIACKNMGEWGIGMSLINSVASFGAGLIIAPPVRTALFAEESRI
jgi:hypothetical protein